jgi:hypothetical protein
MHQAHTDGYDALCTAKNLLQSPWSTTDHTHHHTCDTHRHAAAATSGPLIQPCFNVQTIPARPYIFVSACRSEARCCRTPLCCPPALGAA